VTEFPLSPADTAELCDALVEHVVVFDAEGRIAWANQAAAASAGLAPAALIGHPCPVHCRAEHAGRTQCVVQSVLESGEPHEASLFASERAWHGRSYPLRGPDGRVSGAVGLRLEITDRHKALRQSEARYRTLVDTCPDAILLIDLTGRPLMANQRAAELCGYATTEQLLAQVKNALDLSPSDDRERAAARLREILQSGPTRSAEYDMVSRDGTRIPVEVNASVLRDEDEQAHAVMTVIRDARDRKQAETERRQLEAEVRPTTSTIC
jgi:PAS domain S-box-containing protein